MTEPSQEPTSPGALLRAAREKQGLHIAALAAAIKVSPRKLDALENDRWSELPDATFTRALAQTVCRTLKVDPRPVLDKLPAAAPVVLETQDAGLNTPFRDRPGREEPGLALAAVKPMVLGAAVLMAAAVLIYLLPADLLQRRPVAPVAASAPVGTAQPGVAASAAQVADAGMEPASGAAALAPAFMPDAASAPGPGEPLFVAPPSVAPAPVAAPATAPATVPAAPAAHTVAALPSAPVATTRPATPPGALAAAGLVQLRTSQASWIDVRDAKGATLLSRIVAPGESVGLDGALPIRLVIGNASATQLGFRGQAVDLATRTRDNVARVELQ